MKLLVGLGNPGKNYDGTRHNIGFHCIESFAQIYTGESYKYLAKFQSELLKVAYNNQQIILAKPQTYMNLSGNAIASIARFYDILPKDILVIHDEIDFPIAKIMLKYGGSSAGHNGLKSTIEKLGTQDFWRLRIGVGRPQDQRQISNRVLGKFTVAEKTDLQMKAGEIMDLIDTFIKG